MDKTVSIVIPTHNRENTLRLVINSYLQQKNLKEIIFIDDGSTDSTYQYLEEITGLYPIIRTVRNKSSIGVSLSRNKGIDEASGEYILFGEDDLYLSDDYVPTLLKCMNNTNADIIAGRIVYSRVGEKDDQTVRRCNGYNGPLINYWLMSAVYSKKISNHQHVPFLHAISLVKKSVFQAVMFDRSYSMREETDFYLRATEKGFKVVLCPHTLCIHLPRDRGRGGGWKVGLWKYQLLATRNNNMLVDRHYRLLKKWGMKGNRLTFKLLHLLNRVRILYLYYRVSTR